MGMILSDGPSYEEVERIERDARKNALTKNLQAYIHRVEHEYFDAYSAYLDEQGSPDAKRDALIEINNIRAEFGLPALPMDHFVGVQK